MVKKVRRNSPPRCIVTSFQTVQDRGVGGDLHSGDTWQTWPQPKDPGQYHRDKSCDGRDPWSDMPRRALYICVLLPKPATPVNNEKKRLISVEGQSTQSLNRPQNCQDHQKQESLTCGLIPGEPKETKHHMVLMGPWGWKTTLGRH